MKIVNKIFPKRFSNYRINKGIKKKKILGQCCRCEMVCSTLHNLIVSYGVYKRILDRICRRKRINNYMVMPEMVRRTKTEMEISQYYKIRLYHYTNK